MRPPGVRKDKEFDFFIPSKHRERERARNEIDEQLDALEWEAADNPDLDVWNDEMTKDSMVNTETYVTELERELRYVEELTLGLFAQYDIATPAEGFRKAGWRWLQHAIEELGKKAMCLRSVKGIPRDGTPIIIVTQRGDVLKAIPRKEPFPRSEEPSWVELSSRGMIVSEKAIVGWFPLPTSSVSQEGRVWKQWREQLDMLLANPNNSPSLEEVHFREFVLGELETLHREISKQKDQE